jgi:hypothetical protein
MPGAFWAGGLCQASHSHLRFGSPQLWLVACAQGGIILGPERGGLDADFCTLGMQDWLRGGDPLCKSVLLDVCPKFTSGNHSLDHYSFLVREKRF